MSGTQLLSDLDEKKERQREQHRKWLAKNKDNKEHRQKAVERTKRWRLKNPDKQKAQTARRCPKKRADWYLTNSYGITRDQYDKILKVQKFRCAICKTDTPPKGQWNVDHDHQTDEVRGLLCSNQTPRPLAGM